MEMKTIKLQRSEFKDTLEMKFPKALFRDILHLLV